jgi:hypothetical protein
MLGQRDGLNERVRGQELWWQSAGQIHDLQFILQFLTALGRSGSTWLGGFSNGMVDLQDITSLQAEQVGERGW